MASGVNSTFRQVGIATGIAALGSIFAHQVANGIHGALAGTPAASRADPVSAAVTNGQIEAVLAQAPASARGTHRAGRHQQLRRRAEPHHHDRRGDRPGRRDLLPVPDPRQGLRRATAAPPAARAPASPAGTGPSPAARRLTWSGSGQQQLEPDDVPEAPRPGRGTPVGGSRRPRWAPSQPPTSEPTAISPPPASRAGAKSTNTTLAARLADEHRDVLQAVDGRRGTSSPSARMATSSTPWAAPK